MYNEGNHLNPLFKYDGMNESGRIIALRKFYYSHNKEIKISPLIFLDQ